MKAIIPTAGAGTRLRPHTHTAPKVLLHVAGKPILGHIIDQVVSLGIEEVSFIIGYLGEMVREYVTEAYPALRANFVEQEARDGLGQAIWLTRAYHRDDEAVLIILGDTILQADLREPIASERTMIGVREVDDPRRFGVVEIGPDGLVRRLVEKPEHPKTNLAIVGAYVVRQPALLFESLDQLIADNQRTKGEFQLTDGLARMLERGEPMGTFGVSGWLDCGKPETMLETNRVLLAQRIQETTSASYAERFPDSIIRPPVSIAPRASVDSSIIGPYVSVSDGAHVRGAIVTNSILSKNAKVANILLDASIVSDNAQVTGARTRLNVGDSSEVHLD